MNSQTLPCGCIFYTDPPGIVKNIKFCEQHKSIFDNVIEAHDQWIENQIFFGDGLD